MRTGRRIFEFGRPFTAKRRVNQSCKKIAAATDGYKAGSLASCKLLRPFTRALHSFRSSALQVIRRHSSAVAAVMLACMVPSMTGCNLTTSEPQVEVVELLENTQAVDDSHPWARHIDGIHTELDESGLASSARGVPVMVIGSVHDTLSDEVVRVVGDADIGLAPGADIRWLQPTNAYSKLHSNIRTSISDDRDDVRGGDAPGDKLFSDMARDRIFTLATCIREGSAQQDRAPGKAGVITICDAFDVREIADVVLADLESAPADSEAATYLANLGADRRSQLQNLADTVDDALRKPKFKRFVSGAISKVETEVENARKRGLTVVRSAGDARIGTDTKEWPSKSLIDGVEGIVVVGATELATPENIADDTLATFSSDGWVLLSAPGTGIPCGTQNAPNELSSTRLSSGYVAATVALMLAENPELTPDQVLEILLMPGSSHKLHDERGGVGVIDPVACVSRARDAGLGKLSFAESRAHLLALEAMAVHAAPDSVGQMYVRHVEAIHDSLEAEGLPTRGDGVRVVVIEPSWGRHGGAVSRTIEDEDVGLAPGANISLHDFDEDYNDRHDDLSSRSFALKKDMRAGEAPSTAYAIDLAEQIVLSRAADVRSVRNMHDGQSTWVVNMSYGLTPTNIADRILDAVEEAPDGSDAHVWLESLPADKDARNKAVVQWVVDALSTSEAQSRLQKACDVLSNELAEARQERILVFTSSGNSFGEAFGVENGSVHVSDGATDIIPVGATELNDPLILSDDQSTDFSSAGRIGLAAPGYKIPVGLHGNKNGTSFASPYASAVAVLMIAANPDITPDQIEKILVSTAVDIPGDRDGAGVIDAVAAVKLAKALRVFQ